MFVESAGELTETQKQELEKKTSKLQQQDVELMELRQQLAKLSEIVDKQSAEITQLNSDLKWVCIPFQIFQVPYSF